MTRKPQTFQSGEAIIDGAGFAVEQLNVKKRISAENSAYNRVPMPGNGASQNQTRF
jgi:hypothetical protein